MEQADPGTGVAWAQLGFLIGPAFFLVAAWFLQGPDLVEIPEAPARVVDPAQLPIEPPRKILGDPPVIHINEFDRTCMDCHRIFLNREPRQKREQHQHIKLQHGINAGCDDCHALEDRDRLVLRDGRTIPYTEIVSFCAQCHVDKIADWRLGLHGRRIGFWNASKGPHRKFLCTECHDPHRPRHPIMEGLQPLPSPNTLRMGEPGSHAADTGHQTENQETRNPLRRNQ